MDWSLFDVRLRRSTRVCAGELRFTIRRSQREIEETKETVGNGTPSGSRSYGG